MNHDFLITLETHNFLTTPDLLGSSSSGNFRFFPLWLPKLSHSCRESTGFWSPTSSVGCTGNSRGQWPLSLGAHCTSGCKRCHESEEAIVVRKTAWMTVPVKLFPARSCASDALTWDEGCRRMVSKTFSSLASHRNIPWHARSSSGTRYLHSSDA